MKLFHSPASPYVRLVMATAFETGQAGDIERLPSAAGPVKRDATIVARNPSGKVPTALLEDGSALYDSRVICEYLDSRHGGRRLFPAEGPARWRALTLLSLAQALLDAALLARYEVALRPADKRWDDWLTGQMAKIDSSVAELEAHWIDHLSGELDIGALATACALGYLDFRFADHDWRAGAPKLAAWYRKTESRPCLVETRPAG
ncbi:Glutathione S-transferase [Tistlia consotensis]|uniref:Glutathione S-transferase n=1 Tax=Tistlia consotensis USBA 355 TaxID=560819 RepID=A0A1Y6C5G4_9PROT|nr:glutathione S-transferase [Tistlia consotensis]SMF35599.1 Glutathione S-transferase [Tistlia consotensis USBA 355]SNR71006.1 Glutathione S-transferase [Tistlia consotensis]